MNRVFNPKTGEVSPLISQKDKTIIDNIRHAAAAVMNDKRRRAGPNPVSFPQAVKEAIEIEMRRVSQIRSSVDMLIMQTDQLTELPSKTKLQRLLQQVDTYGSREQMQRLKVIIAELRNPTTKTSKPAPNPPAANLLFLQQKLPHPLLHLMLHRHPLQLRPQSVNTRPP